MTALKYLVLTTEKAYLICIPPWWGVARRLSRLAAGTAK
jgi:hypothetical protein